MILQQKYKKAPACSIVHFYKVLLYTQLKKGTYPTTSFGIPRHASIWMFILSPFIIICPMIHKSLGPISYSIAAKQPYQVVVAFSQNRKYRLEKYQPPPPHSYFWSIETEKSQSAFTYSCSICQPIFCKSSFSFLCLKKSLTSMNSRATYPFYFSKIRHTHFRSLQL